jgi:protein phosphatase
MALKPSAKTVNFAMLSHPGRVRKGNEDTCAAAPEIGAFLVCDGLGGAAAGEVASRLAADVFLKSLTPVAGETPRRGTPDVRLDAAIHAANQAVYEQSQRLVEMKGMGTTLVALLLEPGPPASRLAPGQGLGQKTGAFARAPAPARPVLTLAHVGDSRCYLFREGKLALLTQDHSLVEEQLRLGEISAIEAEYHPMRNIITRAVGSHATVEPEIRHLDPRSGDLYLLASDGLTRELSDVGIAHSIHRFLNREAVRKRAARPDLSILAQTLIDQANDAGGGDNITVLLVHLP